MGKKLRWRVLLILLVVVGAIAGYVGPATGTPRRKWWATGNPTVQDALKKAIKLGLDLRGGIHLVLQVNTADAVKAERDDAIETLQREAKARRPRPRRVPDGLVVHRHGHSADGPRQARGHRQAFPARLDLLRRAEESGRSR